MLWMLYEAWWHISLDLQSDPPYMMSNDGGVVDVKGVDV